MAGNSDINDHPGLAPGFSFSDTDNFNFMDAGSGPSSSTGGFGSTGNSNMTSFDMNGAFGSTGNLNMPGFDMNGGFNAPGNNLEATGGFDMSNFSMANSFDMSNNFGTSNGFDTSNNFGMNGNFDMNNGLGNNGGFDMNNGLGMNGGFNGNNGLGAPAPSPFTPDNGTAGRSMNGAPSQSFNTSLGGYRPQRNQGAINQQRQASQSNNLAGPSDPSSSRQQTSRITDDDDDEEDDASDHEDDDAPDGDIDNASTEPNSPISEASEDAEDAEDADAADDLGNQDMAEAAEAADVADVADGADQPAPSIQPSEAALFRVSQVESKVYGQNEELRNKMAVLLDRNPDFTNTFLKLPMHVRDNPELMELLIKNPDFIQKYLSLPPSVGFNPELVEMLTENPDFIPTFDWNAMMAMTSRDVVNKVSGDIPPPVLTPEDEDYKVLLDFLKQKGLPDPETMTLEYLCSLEEGYLDELAQMPVIAKALGQYLYEPDVEPETISTILPKVGALLVEHPGMLNYYQIPLKKEDGDAKEHGADDEPMVDDDEEEEDTGPKKKGKGKKKKTKKLETKYYPIKVQYSPYKFKFKTAGEARMHRKKIRHPPKVARDIERVKEYGRYYWTKRIYEAMINVDLIFDNKASTIATNFSKVHHFNEDDLEATAHHIFDSCIKVHERGWNRYDYNHKEFKRGQAKDVFPDSIEKRLERVCGILKHNKAVANDCMQGGDLMAQTCDNPIYRASTKTANNKGNIDRSGRLVKVKTEKQLQKEAEKELARIERERIQTEKRLAKEAEAQAKRDAAALAKAERERKKQEEQERKKQEQERKKQEREQKKLADALAKANKPRGRR